MEKRELELYSSCFTLSDMEIFIFPELFYTLVLANIASPIIWSWKKDKWFEKIENRSMNYKVNRIKQYIMNNFEFNLDLETWGKTDKKREFERFSDFVDLDALKKSNALFGYEGDKYYFDIDIRKHFGLDKYHTDVIPYWKTETIEAMVAFSSKKNYKTGAGECVSLSALYAAALFIVGKIPLEDIFLIATPLHSQNFVATDKGLLTNNRRIVTKSMWFNGTPLSTKARRALENENVTIVSHITGYIHWLNKVATIDSGAYVGFGKKLLDYLHLAPSPFAFRCFLKRESSFQKLFCYSHNPLGNRRCIKLEKIYHYEHSSRFSFSDNSYIKLLAEIDPEEFSCCEFEERINLNEFEKREDFSYANKVEEKIMQSYREFLQTTPSLPDISQKKLLPNQKLNISPHHSRMQILEEIFARAATNKTAELTLYTYRQMDKIDWEPFIYAALTRNPVCSTEIGGKSTKEVYQILKGMKNSSIYDENRLAQPDEVWNFGVGDGIEKAVLMASVFERKKSRIKLSDKDVKLSLGKQDYSFSTNKKVGDRSLDLTP